MLRRGTNFVLVDSHVHFHPCYDGARFFAAARRNLAPAATGVLMLTECEGHDAFDTWQRSPPAGLVPRPTGETISLDFGAAEGRRLIVIAGRQLVTTERLELLALGLPGSAPPRAPLAECVAAVREAGALPVLPWGFGKWTGARARIAAAALEALPVLAGDNGGRPEVTPLPRLLRGRRVLRGSDPLPLAGQEERVGAFGFGLELELGERPGAALLARLDDPEAALEDHGAGVSLAACARAQLALRLRRRPAATSTPG